MKTTFSKTKKKDNINFNFNFYNFLENIQFLKRKRKSSGIMFMQMSKYFGINTRKINAFIN